jgi:leucyl aminopeptidase
MKVEISGAQPLKAEANVLAVPLFEEDITGGKGLLAELDKALEGHLLAAAKEERFKAKADSTLSIHTGGRIGASRLLLLGMGKRAGLPGWAPPPELCGWEPLRMAAGRAARTAQRVAADRVAIVLPKVPSGQLGPAVQALVEGALLGAYRFDRYKSERNGKKPQPASLSILGASSGAEVKAAVATAETVAGAIAWCRDLVNTPPLDCTPTRLAEEAKALAKAAGLQCEVKGPKEIAALKMGLFLGVTRGSAEEPRLIRMSYLPKGAGAKKPPVVLVGKAITFDSGGLSLKTAEGMIDMKTDMAGSATAFAAMRVIAHLKPPFPVHALVGACENMPGGRAYKPGDVLVAYNKKTVEIINTDAEGRLVLGDILAWGVDTLKPAAVVDLATLTGACVVALGHYTVGAFGPDGPVIQSILDAARAAGEDFWRLPMTEAVKENLKSEVADMKNSGERWGGAISAAHFLREFVGETPWVHLDIAGPSSLSKERGYMAKGGTGVGVRTLVEFVRSFGTR